MIQVFLVRVLLFPVSLLYGIGILIRNGLYKTGVLREISFNIPVIGVGNLTLGGAGKTPHIEYLIRLLSPYLQIATLSRGYKRKTKGFRLVKPGDNALDVGDEPLQYFLKYPKVVVAVSESRSIGIPFLLEKAPSTQVILLDDSYQHLSVKPHLNILLTEYDRPYSEDFLLPVGRLREWRNGADRADVIIVSKCPENLSNAEISEWSDRLNIKSDQKIFFSKYVYGPLYHIIDGHRVTLSSFDSIILLTAIANEEYLMKYITANIANVQTMIFEDHHMFSPHEISLLKLTFDQIPEERKAIITTEKDATRLALHHEFILNRKLPIYILPLKVEFLGDDGPGFNALMKQQLLEFKH